MNSFNNIGLDLDGVLADFTKAWHGLYPDVSPRPDRYDYDSRMGERFKNMKVAGTLNKFYLGIEPLINPRDLPFEPKCYVTARPVDSEISEQWLNKFGFPEKKVLTVPLGASKIKVIKDAGVELFVDDFYGNFVELNEAGITTYLYSAPWNLIYDVGDMRLNSLNDILLLQD